MNNKLFLLVLFTVLSSSLAVAVDVTLDSKAPNYQRSNLLSARIVQCSGGSSLSIANPLGNQVYYTIGEQEWAAAYNTDSDSADGRYTVEVKCADGTSKRVSFCVNQDGCTTITPSNVQEQPLAEGGFNRGGGSRCTANWACSSWSTCDALGQQIRTCTDTRCSQQPRTEQQACTCQESWICSSWSSCQGGIELRSCSDEHNCGTLFLKPAETQSCIVSSNGGGTSSFFETILPSIQAPLGSSPAQKVWLFVKTYWLFMVLPIVIILLAILLYVLLHKKKHKTYNFGELKEWIGKEREMGTSIEDIKSILKDKTGWTEPEINQAFQELRSGVQNEDN